MAAGCHYAGAAAGDCPADRRRLWAHADWSWPIKAAAVRRASPGSSPTSATCLRIRHGGRLRDVVVAPIGFLSDHMEVMFDLDTEAQQMADWLRLGLVRAGTVVWPSANSSA